MSSNIVTSGNILVIKVEEKYHRYYWKHTSSTCKVFKAKMDMSIIEEEYDDMRKSNEQMKIVASSTMLGNIQIKILNIVSKKCGKPLVVTLYPEQDLTGYWPVAIIAFVCISMGYAYYQAHKYEAKFYQM